MSGSECACVRVDSGLSVFPRRAPVLAHITQRRGSDSSREPTARSLPRRESAIAPARKRKARRRRCGRPEPRKERDGSPLPSQDCFCGFFFLIFTRACASLVPSIRTRSWMFNKEIKCLNSHQKKKKTKPKKKIFSKKQKQKERGEKSKKKKKIQNQTNKQTRQSQPLLQTSRHGRPRLARHPDRGVCGPRWRSCGDRGTEAE